MAVPTLTSSRLCLRPLVAGDAAAIAGALSDWQVSRWLTQVPFPYGPDDAQAFVAANAGRSDLAHWAIDAGDGLIGFVSIKPDLGYWLAPRCHGQGTMTEAAGMVVDWFFGQAPGPLQSGYHLGNAASARVLGKLGFRPGAVVEKPRVSTGQPVAIQTMTLTRDDWQRQAAPGDGPRMA